MAQVAAGDDGLRSVGPEEGQGLAQRNKQLPSIGQFHRLGDARKPGRGVPPNARRRRQHQQHLGTGSCLESLRLFRSSQHGGPLPDQEHQCVVGPQARHWPAQLTVDHQEQHRPNPERHPQQVEGLARSLQRNMRVVLPHGHDVVGAGGLPIAQHEAPGQHARVGLNQSDPVPRCWRPHGSRLHLLVLPMMRVGSGRSGPQRSTGVRPPAPPPFT